MIPDATTGHHPENHGVSSQAGLASLRAGVPAPTPAPVERAAQSLETTMRGVLLMADDEVAPRYARAVFESIDVDELTELVDATVAEHEDNHALDHTAARCVAEAVKAHLTGGAA